MDLPGVLCRVLCVSLFDQLLWKFAPKTSLESGCVGKASQTFRIGGVVTVQEMLPDLD